VGYELFPTSFLAFEAEARWRQLSSGRREGFQLSAGLGIRFGSGESGPRGAKFPEPVTGDASAIPEANASASSGETVPTTSEGDVTIAAKGHRSALLADSVVWTATAMMGRKYQYGGTGEDGEGFDCSGLIQYAYAQYGVSLPRRSTDQARDGRKVPKQVEALEPADLLTFSNRGGPVTHVGLYIGNGRFIHSASHGVQVSTLSAEDPYGRWWFKRWVGVRRILTNE
jgi:lipoprotein Spr